MKINAQRVIFILATGLMILLIAFPLALVFYKSFLRENTLSLVNYIDVFSEKNNYFPFLNTLKIGALTVIFATAMGVILAWLVARTDIPFKGFLDTLLLVPYMIPPFIGAIAWTQLLSPRVGYINKIFMQIFDASQGPFNIYSLMGIVWVMALYNYPFVFITVRGALERMDPSLEESARIAGAGRIQVMKDITLPLAVPAIVSGMLLVFVFTIANFGIPAIIGMRSRIYVLTTQIYRYLQMYTGGFSGVRLAAALSTLLMCVAGIAVYASSLGKKKYAIIVGKSVRPGIVELGNWKYLIVGILTVFLMITLIAPLISIFLTSFLKAWGVPVKLENLSFKNYKYILFGYDYTRIAIKNSFLLAFSAAIITTIIGSIIAYISVKTEIKGRKILDFLTTLPYSIPGTVVAIAMILAWSGQFGVRLYYTFWIILIAYIARYMFFAFRNVSASLEQIHPSLEEAARVSGATWLQNFRDIVIPLIRPGLVASFLLVFMPTLRELTISILLVGPKTTTIGAAVYNLQEEGLYQITAALSSLIIVILFIGNYLVKKVINIKTTNSI